MPSRTVVIRADASSEMGIGHVMRCLALAHEWQSRGGRVVFALARGAHELSDRIRSHVAEVLSIVGVPGSIRDAACTLELTEEYDASWLVVDGYHFSADYLRTLGGGAARLLILTDDGELPSCDCDIVVDPSVEIAGMPVTFPKSTEVLQGPAYALLRREFLTSFRQSTEVPETARRILITFGGGDSPNAGLAVLSALRDIADFELEVTVVLGPSNPHRTTLELEVRQSRHMVKLLENISNMAEIMAGMDLAVTGGGGTCYELALMRVPMFLITIAENQEQTAAALAYSSAAISAGPLHSLGRQQLSNMLADVIRNRGLRSHIAEQAQRMVDGKGAERIVQRMLALESNETQTMESSS